MLPVSVNLPPWRPNRRRAQIVIALFGAFVLLDLMLIAALAGILGALQPGEAGAAQLLTAPATVRRLELLSNLQIIAYLVTSLCFLFWIHRAYQNLEAVDARYLDYSPSWAVGAFFVPFLNLVRPYQIVSEIWLKSEPDQTRLESFATQPSFPLIKVWWLAFIAGNVLGRVADTAVGRNPDPDRLVMPIGLTIVALGLQIISAISGSLVIKSIEDRQTRRARLIRSDWMPPEEPRWNPAWFALSIGLGILIGGITLAQSPTADQPATSAAGRVAPTSAAASIDHKQRGVDLLDNGDYYAAIDEFNLAIAADAADAELFVWRGIAYRNTDNYPAARRDLDEAVRLDPQSVDAYIARGITLLWAGEYDQALADFDQAIKLDGRSAEAHNGRGWTLLAMDDYARAIAAFNQALQNDKAYADAYEGKGRVYYYQGNYEAAIDNLTRALALDDTLDTAYNYRGLTYLEQAKWTDAVADFSRAVKIDPTYVNAYYNRGYAYYQQKRYAEALTDYDRAIELAGDFAEAYYERGLVYADFNQPDKAIADLQQAIDLGLSAEDEASAQDMIELLRERLQKSTS